MIQNQAQLKSVAVIGTGPAGLMAADVLSQSGSYQVSVFEKNKGPGFKLLIAGSSGLNIGNDHSLENFIEALTGPPAHFKEIFSHFFTSKWMDYIKSLGLTPFRGSSGKFFVREMKSARLLQLWIKKLKSQKVQFHYESELLKIKPHTSSSQWQLKFQNKSLKYFDGVVLAMGGGSWLKETPSWIQLFEELKLKITPLQASNCGYEVLWPELLLKEAEGLPLKNILFTTSKGSMKGDLVITQYGLEGAPIYFYGKSGEAFIDFFPDFTEEKILTLCKKVRENKSPLRVLKKAMPLNKAAHALLFHLSTKEDLSNLNSMVSQLKNLKLKLQAPRPLSEAISSSGGLAFSEVDKTLMIQKYPGIFVAGEILDWDAPTGGFLVQTCVSQGYHAGKSLHCFFQKSFLD